MIRYLEHNEIDKDKWDDCIRTSDHPKSDILCWYLDIVCPGWSALVYDDYKVVMPLPVRKKYGITYVYKPFFIQQLGIIGKKVKSDKINDFLNKIPAKIKLADIILDETLQLRAERHAIQGHSNYLLDIKNSYNEVRNQYHRNCIRNINKAKAAGFKFRSGISLEEFAGILFNQIIAQEKNFGTREKEQFKLLIKESINRNAGELVGIFDNNNRIVAAAFFIISFDRIMFKVCGSIDEGKKHQAMYMLVDEQIKRYSGQYMWFDFQGSDMDGIAYFNSTFGTIPHNYYSLHINRLPGIIKFLSGKKPE